MKPLSQLFIDLQFNTKPGSPPSEFFAQPAVKKSGRARSSDNVKTSL
jgi:hypothetical protein